MGSASVGWRRIRLRRGGGGPGGRSTGHTRSPRLFQSSCSLTGIRHERQMRARARSQERERIE